MKKKIHVNKDLNLSYDQFKRAVEKQFLDVPKERREAAIRAEYDKHFPDEKAKTSSEKPQEDKRKKDS